MQLITTREVENFGRNLRFIPTAYYEPASECELLEILQRHQGSKIKAVGSLHAWSPAAQGDEVVVSTRLFNGVKLDASVAEKPTAVWVGAGIQIKDLIPQLDDAGISLPSLGLISEQTLAGAVSTGTHGSGRHCLSHFVQAVRLARYDDLGQPVIETIDSGDELRALQCGLGSLGIIVELQVTCRERYNIAELWRRYDNLEQVLACEQEFPLQQFFLVPWKWSYLAQHRQEANQSTSKLHWLYRWYFFLAVDLALHLVLLTAGKLFNSTRMVQGLFSRFLWRSIIPNWLVVGPSYKMLIMEHEIFRHIETELFVTADRLAEALDFIQKCLTNAAGTGEPISTELSTCLTRVDLLDEFNKLNGKYCHHYPICVRRILPDTTLLSMTSGGDKDWYSISLISYHRSGQRGGFLETMSFLSRAMARLFAARPHWGKHNPLPAAELVKLYPEFRRFVEVCRKLDPQGRFCNRWFQGYLDTTS
jgi:L-gulono-1,4-lactone dehydrogenase